MLHPDYRFEKAKIIFIYLTTYHSPMRFILLTNVLLLSAYSLFAQTNPFKDEKVQKEKAAQFITSHHISEIDQTLVVFKDGQVIDSSKTEDFYYDNKGRQSKTMLYLKAYSNTYPEGRLINQVTNYDYDKRGNEVSAKGNGFPANETRDYAYDKQGNIIKETEDQHMVVVYNQDRLGGIRAYTYDKRGNVLTRKNYSLDGKFAGVTQYIYNDKDELLKSLTFKKSVTVKGDSAVMSGHEEYTYNYASNGLTKVQFVYNAKDSLTLEKIYMYDTNGNQTKGYEMRGTVKNLVWDYTYDQLGRVTASMGGPATLNGLGNKDLRRDGLAHLFYTYNDDGELITIKRIEKDATTGQEQVLAIEKLSYKH